MRHLCASAAVVILILGVLSPPLSLGQTPGTTRSGAPLYMGVGSCAAVQCHGSLRELTTSKAGVRQTEHPHWLFKEKHAKAYEVLLKDRSLVMAKNLNMAEPPAQSERCLVCHAMYAPREARGPKFQLEDGVSCEACHGPAGVWLENHIDRKYEDLLKEGMYNTRDLAKRAEKCVQCHVGDETRNVDHELIAAGHPDLVFELDTYTAILPPHWRISQDEGGGKDWAVGQAVALRESLKRLARRTQQPAAPAWPEFAEFECFACHHEVKNVKSTYYHRGPDRRLQPVAEWPVSWREARGYPGVAGIPPWNPARYFIFRQFVQVAAPESRNTLEQELNNINTLMAKVGANDPAQIAAAANRAVQTVDALLARVMAQKMEAQFAGTLLRNIASDSTAIAGAGFRVAEQAVMAVQTFAPVAQKNGKSLEKDPAIKNAIDSLFRSVEKPAMYDPQQFATQMRAIHSFLTQ
jgi:cytochrome c554/c'-like protein